MAGARHWKAPALHWREQYTAQGLNMLPEHAQFEDKSVSVEAGLMDMLSRMQTGRFKVFANCSIGVKNSDCITARMVSFTKRATI